jgi:hypothetical protein
MTLHNSRVQTLLKIGLQKRQSVSALREPDRHSAFSQAFATPGWHYALGMGMHTQTLWKA